MFSYNHLEQLLYYILILLSMLVLNGDLFYKAAPCFGRVVYCFPSRERCPQEERGAAGNPYFLQGEGVSWSLASGRGSPGREAER